MKITKIDPFFATFILCVNYRLFLTETFPQTHLVTLLTGDATKRRKEIQEKKNRPKGSIFITTFFSLPGPVIYPSCYRELQQQCCKNLQRHLDQILRLRLTTPVL
jgi:hypothetical protein